MDFSTLKLFPDNLIKAIGNTLVHSLWQGLLLAAITGFIIVFTRKSSPAKRYNLLITALVLFTTTILSTFIFELNHAQVGDINRSAITINNNLPVKNTDVKFFTQAIQKTTLTDKAVAFFNKNADNIVLIWFLIVCARSLQLITGLNGLYYLRRKNIVPVDDDWELRVQQLATKLGIKQLVGIAESGIAKVPMVIGHLKPLILIPIGLMTTLSTEEIEAILVHELAHIRRRDYLINMLQSLLEIVFFFNPALLWISALIRNERENCCDDIAVAQSSSKMDYIKALVSCQEYRLSAPAYAMSLKGKNGHLMARVKRIISNNNHSLNLMEKSLLAICLIISGLLTTAFSNAGKINSLLASSTKIAAQVSSNIKREMMPNTAIIKVKTVTKKDTIIHSKLRIFQPDDIGENTSLQIPNNLFTTYLYKEKGILYQLNLKSKVLSSVQINGKTLQSNQFSAYQPMINQILQKNSSKFSEVKENVEVPEPVEPAEEKVLVKPAVAAKPMIAKTTESITFKANAKSLQQLDTSAAKLKNNNIKLSASIQKLNEKPLKLNEMKDLAIADSVNQAYKKAPVSKYGSSVYNSKPANYKPYESSYKPYVNLNDDTRKKQTLDDMLKDGIITTTDNLSFKLSTEEFIVNGKKQPDEVYQKYRAKYVKITGHNEWTWYYNYDTDQHRETNSITDSRKN